MVDYDTAVSIVQDSNADPVMLAKVAYENPEFGANVAANPRAYPGLRRWIAQFGDDRARETLKSMGFEVPDQAVSPREAQPQSEPQASATSHYADMQTQQNSSISHIANQQDFCEPDEQNPQMMTIHPVTNVSAYFDSVAPDASQSNSQQAQPTYVQQIPVATNAYGYTAEQALDPNTDQMTIASIAQYAPELRPCLARNPNTYPELLNWLAQLHDPAIDAALATRQQ
ncbi:hypothetical protein OZX57_01960 [Bifidobacterium sp. ESL0682]|uniref:variant leucine-rich repeat-containing protein n=1 Tax=Bifidobacterium sp. ESL0682 TaxID=2983212 RepID=UPI0023F82E81|nr:hypothetical protein [Bifidobacterium sp. ESL0682]WEV42273.1 hypothetical protein OZX57_01960 [Bifidobacterium sp. ESL0682]